MRSSPSAERLVAFLALQPRASVRSHVAGVLWADRGEERAAACLRSAIWRVGNAAGAPVLDSGRSRVTLNPAVRVDARDAVATARKLLCGGACQVDPQMLAGELLRGWYDDWVLVERERLRLL